MPLLILLVGGGLLLTLYSRMLPFVGIRHAVQILQGRYDDPNEPGEITHFQALSTALAATVGMGNIGGVAIAITQGGAGAVFWMWVAAIVGMATKFFTCTLAIMYRGKDSAGQLQGGPMYFLSVGLGRWGKPLAIFFSVCGMVGCLAMFQPNQLAEAIVEVVEPASEAGAAQLNHLTGAICVVLSAVVILGGVQRIATVASKLVPLMCLLYVGSALIIIVLNIGEVPAVFGRIVRDAFGTEAVAGGAVGYGFMKVVQIGVKRAAFSNEAGIGTAPMAHGAAKTNEPVREGLVAMLGPFIDTVVVCSMTAFIILVGGNWQGRGKITGVGLTLESFDAALGPVGKYMLLGIIAMFALSTMFGYSYYGRKCFGYLFGAHLSKYYNYVFIGSLYLGAIWQADLVINLLDTSFALMAFPTMIGAIVLSPKVVAATRDYFRRMREVEQPPKPQSAD
ncbi:MAG: alanine:cation symporter family protein [Deltaproteobacteria bacterium]|nr:alanine:cation symporter family protein [Deltaproteobacteria bacterium]MBW2536782.1 alanine:cation symporter family protein [Deltaproteobacteria bacterium]